MAKSSTHHPLFLALLSALVILQPGCGVIFGYGNPQPVRVIARVQSTGEEIEGLKVKDKDGTVLEQTTPGPVYLHPKADHSLSIDDPRYRSTGQNIRKTTRIGIVILDALTLGIGLIVDYLSGALNQMPDHVVINMTTAEAYDKLQTERPKNDPRPVDNGQPDGPRDDGIWVKHFVTGERVFIANDAKACAVCGGQRGDMTPCPHCGVKE